MKTPPPALNTIDSQHSISVIGKIKLKLQNSGINDGSHKDPTRMLISTKDYEQANPLEIEDVLNHTEFKVLNYDIGNL